MRNLSKFIVKYHFFFLFVIIEAFSIFLITKNNNYQKAKFVNFAWYISGYFFDKVNSFTEYLSLKEINRELVEENAQIFNDLRSLYKSNKVELFEINDSNFHQHYIYTHAKVINNSTNKQYNFLTLDKGTNHGIEVEMAVISYKGIVGVINSVSKNFSSVISFLNLKLKVSAKLKKNNYFGPVSWEGKDYTKATLSAIPYNVDINIGDTIITSGYSTIFPEGILIGFISDFELKGGNFYDITVKLSTNFKNISYVNVVNNLLKEEQINLEKTSQND